jgi:6-phosphogluconolactonase
MENLTKILLMTLIAVISSCSHEEKVFVASGYSAEGQPDVKMFKVSSEGVPEALSDFTCGENPSFFTPGRKGLFYFVNEVDSFNNKPGGGITTLRLDPKTNTFTRLGSINQGGGGPCHVLLTDDNKYLLTANYGSGSLSVVSVNDSGIPEKVTDKLQFGEKSHPHMVIFNPVKQVYYMSDLGLNRIYIFRSEINEGILLGDETSFIQMEEGTGPRHMVIDKACRNLYVINELNSTVSVIDITAKVPVLKQTIGTLPEGFTGKNYCADIHLSPSGKFLYGSNRGHNSIVVFSVARIGELTMKGHFPCGGDWPRNFAVNGIGNTLAVANQRSGLLSLFSTEKSGGAIDEKGQSIPFNTPACIKFIK